MTCWLERDGNHGSSVIARRPIGPGNRPTYRLQQTRDPFITPEPPVGIPEWKWLLTCALMALYEPEEWMCLLEFLLESDGEAEASSSHSQRP